MQSTQSPEDGNEDKEMSSLAKFTGIAFQMVVVIGIFAFAGYKIDQYAAHKVQWVTALLSLTGVFIAMYIVIRSLKQ